MVLLFTSTFNFSSMIGCTPMQPNNSIMVVISYRWGKLQICTVSSVNSVAAKIGNAEFFAPAILISPRRLTPPVINSLSTLGSLNQKILRDRIRQGKTLKIHSPAVFSASVDSRMVTACMAPLAIYSLRIL